MKLQKILEESWKVLLQSLEAFLTAERFRSDVSIQLWGLCLNLYLHPAFCLSSHRMPTNIYVRQQPAQSTGKLMPPLTGIGEVSIHHAAVVQIWQRLPVQLTRRSIPTSPDREAAHGCSITNPPAACYMANFLAASCSQQEKSMPAESYQKS
jgi:hypothetical protein